MDVRKLDDLLAQGRGIFEMKIAVAYYARVSTEKDEQLNSLDNQRRFYEEFIRSNPNWTFAGGYVDEGISGTSVAKREQFLQMIEDAEQGKFDLIVTKEISRFARNTLDSIRYTRELLRHGVGVFFQNDNINTFDKDAELRLTIMSSIAQDEVRKLSERTRFGFKRAQENSVLLGQNNLFGYNKVDGRLEIVESEAEIVREVFERYVAGDLGLRAIANDLDSRGIVGRQGKPVTYSTLYGMIRNPKYKGCYAGRRYATRDYNYSVPCEFCGKEVSVKASPETVSIYLAGTCIAQHKRCLERKKTIYDLAHYLPLLEKKGRAIFYARPVQETIPESFLHWLRSQDLTSKELVEILHRCQEEDYMEIMKKAPSHTVPVEIQDTVIVQAVDLHLYDVFIYGKAGAAL